MLIWGTNFSQRGRRKKAPADDELQIKSSITPNGTLLLELRNSINRYLSMK